MKDDECTICRKPAEVLWRLQEVEKRVDGLGQKLTGALISSVSTLVGVIVILLTK